MNKQDVTKFIKNVKAETKCDRVALSAFSMGGTVTLSYLYKCSTDYLLGKSNEKPPVVLDTDGLTAEQIQALQTLIKTMKHE